MTVQKRLQLVLCLAVAGAAVSAACSSSTDTNSPPPASSSQAKAFCDTDTAADDFFAGMHKAGANGYDVTIADASPLPPKPDKNTWTLLVKNPAGDPVDGATLGVDCKMPLHNHGCFGTAKFTALGGGQYEVSDLQLLMPDHWDVTFTITDGTQTDTVTFGLCLK